jgi:hypothetical protein
MKIIISENRVARFVSEYIDMSYGELNQVYDESENRFMWFLEGEEPENTYPLFELTESNTLYVPHDFVKKIGDLFGFEYKREVDEVIMDCWKYMFGLNPERVNVYF